MNERMHVLTDEVEDKNFPIPAVSETCEAHIGSLSVKDETQNPLHESGVEKLVDDNDNRPIESLGNEDTDKLDPSIIDENKEVRADVGEPEETQTSTSMNWMKQSETIFYPLTVLLSVLQNLFTIFLKFAKAFVRYNIVLYINRQNIFRACLVAAATEALMCCLVYPHMIYLKTLTSPIELVMSLGFLTIFGILIHPHCHASACAISQYLVLFDALVLCKDCWKLALFITVLLYAIGILLIWSDRGYYFFHRIVSFVKSGCQQNLQSTENLFGTRVRHFDSENAPLNDTPRLRSTRLMESTLKVLVDKFHNRYSFSKQTPFMYSRVHLVVSVLTISSCFVWAFLGYPVASSRPRTDIKVESERDLEKHLTRPLILAFGCLAAFYGMLLVASLEQLQPPNRFDIVDLGMDPDRSHQLASEGDCQNNHTNNHKPIVTRNFTSLFKTIHDTSPRRTNLMRYVSFWKTVLLNLIGMIVFLVAKVFYELKFSESKPFVVLMLRKVMGPLVNTIAGMNGVCEDIVDCFNFLSDDYDIDSDSDSEIIEQSTSEGLVRVSDYSGYSTIQAGHQDMDVSKWRPGSTSRIFRVLIHILMTSGFALHLIDVLAWPGGYQENADLRGFLTAVMSNFQEVEEPETNEVKDPLVDTQKSSNTPPISAVEHTALINRYDNGNDAS